MTVFAPFPEARSWQAASPIDAGQFVAEIKSGRSLSEADRARWARLTARAECRNIFAADWFMASALRHCAAGLDVRLAIVRSLDGEWLGVLPVSHEKWLGRCPIPVWQSWMATNQFDASPLIARGSAHIFWHCLLTQLDRRPGMALALACDELPLDDPATTALVEVCLAHGRWHTQTHRAARPMRAAGPLSAEAMAARRKLDKRLDALTRKLHREVGEPRFVSLAPGADPAPWIAQFLALEQSGWKGGNASALGCDQRTAGMFREVIRIAHRQGSARLMSMEAGGRTIAMTSWLTQRQRAYGFKMAYDEAFRGYAPGRLLMRAVADEAAADPALVFDSCARADAPGDPLWPHARTFADFVISIGSPARRAVLSAAMRAKAIYAQRRA